MAIFLPFKGILPAKEYAEAIVSKNPDDYSKEEMAFFLEKKSFSFLRIIKPALIGIQNFETHRGIKFQEVKKYLNFIQKDLYRKGLGPAYYIYQRKRADQIFFVGFTGLISVQDLLDGLIKKHEHTLKKRKQLFVDYLLEVAFRAEPDLLIYQQGARSAGITSELMLEEPVFSFDSKNNPHHTLWRVEHTDQIKAVGGAFEKIYILLLI